MIHSRTGIGGIRVGFRVQPTPFAAFKAVLQEFGFDKFCPNPRTDQSALTATVAEKLGGRNRLVAGKGGRGKKKTAGVEVVDVTRQSDAFNEYNPLHMAKVKRNGHGPVVVLDNFAEDHELTEEFLRTKAVLTSSAINSALRGIMVQEMSGLSSFTGIYVPEALVPSWKALAERLFGAYDHDGNLIAEGICGGEYEVATVDLDADTIRSIRARLATETKAEVGRISWDTLKGTLNAEQVLTRCDDAKALLEKISLYEQEFRLGLDDLKEAAEKANQIAAAALFRELSGSGVGV